MNKTRSCAHTLHKDRVGRVRVIAEKVLWKKLSKGWTACLRGGNEMRVERLPKGTKNHHCTSRVMVAASSHVPLYSLVESTQSVYGIRLFFVSARTNKRHHHHCGAPTRFRACVGRQRVWLQESCEFCCSKAYYVPPQSSPPHGAQSALRPQGNRGRRRLPRGS